MTEIFEDAQITTTEKPWTKLQVVASTAFVFSVACCASVVMDKALVKLLKL